MPVATAPVISGFVFIVSVAGRRGLSQGSGFDFDSCRPPRLGTDADARF